MDPSLRVVIRLPLEELWHERGAIEAARERWLARPEIVELLRRGPVQFIVARSRGDSP